MAQPDLRRVALALMEEHSIKALVAVDQETIPDGANWDPNAMVRTKTWRTEDIVRSQEVAWLVSLVLRKHDPGRAVFGKLRDESVLLVSFAQIYEIAEDLDNAA
jgi:hypothetical protein